MKILQYIISIILSLACLGVKAQERPVLSAYSVEVGTSHIADTYLTPLHYNGTNYAVSYERMQAMKFNPENWVMQLDTRVMFDNDENPTHNATMLNLEVEAAWAMMRRWKNPFGSVPHLTVGIGPGTSLRGGVLYLSRNGNNPASAKGAWTLNASAFATYNMRISKVPITLRYDVMLPVTGAFFAPEYGQLYYEIWLGNRSGIVRPAWWGNYFRIDNMLTADLRLGGTALRIGYHNDIISTKAHNIVSQRISHAFTLAVVTEWISLSPRHNDNNLNIISAL